MPRPSGRSRRRVLGSLVALGSAALAGCTGGSAPVGRTDELPNGYLFMEATSLTALPEKVLPTVGGGDREREAGDFERVLDGGATLDADQLPVSRDEPVVYDGVVYRLSAVRADRTSPAGTDTYRYTADRVATTAEYGRRVRDRFGFELTDLSAAQRDIVETAIAEENYRLPDDATPTAGFVSLVSRIREHEQVRALHEGAPDRERGKYVVTYDDTLYWTELFVTGRVFRAES